MSALPGAAAGELLALTNPGFEDGLTGWVGPSESTQTEIAVDDQVSHGGQASLRLCGQDNQNPWLAQGIAPIEPLAEYQLSAYARGLPQEPLALAVVKIEFYDAQNNNLSGYYGTLVTAKDGSWQQTQVNAQADETAAKVAVVVRLLGPGTVWFDDIEFTMTQPPPGIVVVPKHLTAAASRPGQIGLQLKLPQPTEALPDLNLQIAGPLLAEPVTVSAKIERADQQTFEAIVDIPELAAGVYQLLVTGQNEELRGVASLVTLPADRQPAGLSAQGHLVVEGQPFFPIGLYHVNVDDYPQVAAARFNCVQGPATDDLQELRAALDAAQEAGLKVVVPLYNDASQPSDLQTAAQKVQQFADHAAVLLWKMADEPDLWPNVYTQVAKVYLRLKAIAKHQPLQLTIANPAQYRRWAPLCEVLEVAPYPLPQKPLQLVSDYVAQSRDVLAPGQGLLALLQAGWSADLSTQPSVEQARMMMYLALLNGARGVFWYCLRDPGWDLTATSLWNHFGEINQELATLGQVVLEGETVADVDCTEESVVVQAFRHNDEVYVLMVNGTDEVAEGRLRLPVKIIEASWLRTGQSLGCGTRTVSFTLPAQQAETAVVTEEIGDAGQQSR